MDCEVLRGREEEEIDIAWVFITAGDTFSRLLSNTDNNKFTINEVDFPPTIQRSQLRVDFLNDDDAGCYACQVRFRRNDTFALSSQTLRLDTRDVFRDIPSNSCLPFEVQSVMEPACAVEETVSIGDGVSIGPSDNTCFGGDGGGSGNGGDGAGGIPDSDSLVIWSTVGGILLLVIILVIVLIILVCLFSRRSKY